jgi:hypothetical protein
LMMPMVEVRTMSPTTTATCPRYGRNSGVTRRACSAPRAAAARRWRQRPARPAVPGSSSVHYRTRGARA